MNILSRFLRLGRLLPAKASNEISCFASFSAAVGRRLPSADCLETRLEVLAQAFVESSRVVLGALIVVCTDNNRALGYGKSRFIFRDGEGSLLQLSELCCSLPHSGSHNTLWSDVGGEQVQFLAEANDASLIARSLPAGDHDRVFVFLRLADTEDAVGLVDLEEILLYLVWLIQDSLRAEHDRLLNVLRSVEIEEYGSTREIDSKRVAEELKRVFDASAVTILWREQGKLYLSATTDVEVMKEKVIYDPGKGFTGHIVKTGQPVLLYDATDEEEVRRSLGPRAAKQRGKVAQYPEALVKAGKSFQLLAVPMRLRKDKMLGHEEDRESTVTHGVIRILREAADRPFTHRELQALQHFADLFGLALISSWHSTLMDHILKAETEAICITRNELEKGSDGLAIPTTVYGDPGTEALFGMKNKELRGRDGRQLYLDGEYHKVRLLLRKAIRDKKSVCGPIRVKVKRKALGGTDVRIVDISYRLLESPFVTPNAHYTIAVIRDVTDRQHLAQLVDSKGLAYFRADANSVTVETSEAESRLTGYSVEQLEGMVRDDLYMEDGGRKRQLTRVRRAGGKFVLTRDRLKRQDGEWFWAEGFVRLMKDRNGRETGIEGLYEDVTDRLKLQGFLDVEPGKLLEGHELYSKLEENARFQLLFMTSLSHQLRSPLAALAGHLENFNSGITDASRFSSDLKYCIGQTRVCGQLVTNLSYMDRILRGESFRFGKVKLSRLAIETKLDFEDLARGKDLSFDVPGKDLDKIPDVSGHDGLLRQVLINLYDNAIKYSLPGTTIELRSVSDVGGPWFQISNEGFRVPKESREKIFEQGFRLPNTKAAVPDGGGLGLWLVRKILDAHGARIRCVDIYDSRRNRTAFQIKFPAEQLGRSVDTSGVWRRRMALRRTS